MGLSRCCPRIRCACSEPSSHRSPSSWLEPRCLERCHPRQPGAGQLTLPIPLFRLILVERATVRLTLSAPFTPSRGPAGWPLWPLAHRSRCPTTPGRPRSGARSSTSSFPGGLWPPLLAYNHEEEEPMSNENVELFRSAYDTYSRGDVSAILRFVSRRDHQEARAFAGLD